MGQNEKRNERFSNRKGDFQLKFEKIIRAPGQGLLTVSTGSMDAQKLLGSYFGPAKLKNWSQEFSKRRAQKARFSIIGVPSDSGGGICRGAAHGPTHLRAALYRSERKLSKFDLGDIPCIPQLLDDEMLTSDQLRRSGVSLWGNSYVKGTPVSPLNLLEELLVELWRKNISFRPLVLGGDHSISGAIFRALKRAKKMDGLGVIHFDAHTDLLEERYGVKNCFATWTAHAVHEMKVPQAWVQLGIRASRHSRKYWEKKFGLKQHWAKDLVRIHPDRFSEHLISHFDQLGCRSLYITNDIDGTDSRFAPSTGTPESKGLTPVWISRVIQNLSSIYPLVGADLMEVAPVLGSPADRRKTLLTSVRYLKALRW